MVVRNKQFEKRQPSRWQPILAYFFWYYWAWQTLCTLLPGCTRSFGNHCASYKIISVTPRGYWKHNFLIEKQDFFPVKNNILAHFISYNRMWKTSGNNIKGSIRFCDNCCWSCKINSLGPKTLLNINFFKKLISSEWKNWLVCSRFKEYGRPEVKLC